MGYNVVEKSYATSENLINDVLYSKELWFKNDVFIYRGHGRSDYQLTPVVLRKFHNPNRSPVDILGDENLEANQQEAEFQALISFHKYANALGLFVPDYANVIDAANRRNRANPNQGTWPPTALVPLAALAQHYGIPTRLLDWSRDILVAIFFAAYQSIYNYKKEDKIVIWALNEKETIFRQQYYDSDFPLKLVNQPSYSNKNLHAQSGVLTYWEVPYMHVPSANLVNAQPLDLLLSEYFKSKGGSLDEFLLKLTLPTTELPNLFNTLFRLNYTAYKIFPEYSGIKLQFELEAKIREILA